MVKIFARTHSAKIELAGIYFQTKLIFSDISKQKAVNKLMHILHIFIEYCNPIFLDKPKIAI